MKIQKEKVIILLTVLVDVIGLGIVIPVLPFYVQSYGATPFVVTLLFAVFSLCSFLSAPLLGALSDKIGRRPVLILSIFSSAVGWLVFASANSLWVLFLGRIIDGMAAGNFPTAQSYLSDISRNPKERTANLGLIGAMFGIGLVIGPASGAILGGISPAFPFYVVGSLAMLNALGAVFFLPETHHKKDGARKITFNPLTPLFNAARETKLRSRYAAWFLYGIAFSVMQAVFALYLNAKFGIGAAATGYIFTGMGVVMALNQGLGLKLFWLKKFKEATLEVRLFPLLALGFLLMDAPWISAFFVGLLMMVLSRSVIHVAISARVAEIAGNRRRGEILGTMSSIFSAATVVGPLLAGTLFQFNIFLPLILCAVLSLLAFWALNISRHVGVEVLPLDEEISLPPVY